MIGVKAKTQDSRTVFLLPGIEVRVQYNSKTQSSDSPSSSLERDVQPPAATKPHQPSSSKMKRSQTSPENIASSRCSFSLSVSANVMLKVIWRSLYDVNLSQQPPVVSLQLSSCWHQAQPTDTPPIWAGVIFSWYCCSLKWEPDGNFLSWI